MKGIAPTAYKANLHKARESAEYYNVLSQGYDELYGEEQKRKYKKGLKMLRPSWRVLDVGCGTALLSEFVDGIYIGLDVSPGMLKTAKERVEGKTVSLVLGEASYLPFRSKSFEACYSFTVLQNVPDPEGALRELKRVCKRALVSSLKGKYLRGEACEEVYPDVMCLVVD